jgi:DNA-binding CsgD family transcriptional regulator
MNRLKRDPVEMAHLSLVLIILTFGGGMVASSHAVLLYYRFPIRYLKFHSALLVFLNTVVFLGLLFNYFQLNLIDKPPFITGDIFYKSYYLALSLLTVFVLYALAGAVFIILKTDWTRRGRVLFRVYFPALILGQVVNIFVNPGGEGFPLYVIFLLGTAVSFFVGNYILIYLLYSQSRRLTPGERQRWLRTLSAFLFVVVTASLCLDTLQITAVLALWIYLLLKAVAICAVNIVSLVRLKAFVKVMFPQETVQVGANAHMERLFEKHKLTDRERQVTLLICGGKSSRDIGNELFLSSHTIKEYIYRVYKKTGVKNRVQLINLFRDQ